MTGRFILLDDYKTTIMARIATPELKVAPNVAFTVPTETETLRWPPPNITYPTWAVASVLSSHCQLLSTKPGVTLYAHGYWRKNGTLPSLGHVHFLYNQSIGMAPWCHTTAENEDTVTNIWVDVPSALCICDCAMLPGDSVIQGPLLLLSHWIGAVAVWRLGEPATTPDDVPWLVYCVHWPETCVDRLTDVLRNPAWHPRWIPTLLQITGATVDFSPRLLQCAMLTVVPFAFPPLPRIVHALWHGLPGGYPVAGRIILGGEDGVPPQWAALSRLERNGPPILVAFGALPAPSTEVSYRIGVFWNRIPPPCEDALLVWRQLDFMEYTYFVLY